MGGWVWVWGVGGGGGGGGACPFLTVPPLQVGVRFVSVAGWGGGHKADAGAGPWCRLRTHNLGAAARLACASLPVRPTAASRLRAVVRRTRQLELPPAPHALPRGQLRQQQPQRIYVRRERAALAHQLLRCCSDRRGAGGGSRQPSETQAVTSSGGGAAGAVPQSDSGATARSAPSARRRRRLLQAALPTLLACIQVGPNRRGAGAASQHPSHALSEEGRKVGVAEAASGAQLQQQQRKACSRRCANSTAAAALSSSSAPGAVPPTPAHKRVPRWAAQRGTHQVCDTRPHVLRQEHVAAGGAGREGRGACTGRGHVSGGSRRRRRAPHKHLAGFAGPIPTGPKGSFAHLQGSHNTRRRAAVTCTWPHQQAFITSKQPTSNHTLLASVANRRRPPLTPTPQFDVRRHSITALISMTAALCTSPQPQAPAVLCTQQTAVPLAHPSFKSLCITLRLYRKASASATSAATCLPLGGGGGGGAWKCRHCYDCVSHRAARGAASSCATATWTGTARPSGMATQVPRTAPPSAAAQAGPGS